MLVDYTHQFVLTLFLSPIFDNIAFTGFLFVSGSDPQRMLAPGSLGILQTNSAAAFAATVGMRSGVLSRAPNCRSNTSQSTTTGFTPLLIFPIQITNLADCSETLGFYQSDLLRR